MACNCNGNNTDINSSCSGCGGTCDQQLTPGCSTRCGCQTSNPSPTPFYLQGGGCQESHDRVIVQNRYAAALSTKSDAIVPACGGQTTLTVDGLVSIPVGAYVWSAVIGGYLKVVSFDYVQGQIVVENDCSVDGGTPGASIPRCSLFIVTPPPQTLSSIGPSSLYPFVAVDFTAPANGNCLDITVTNVNGLVVGKNVQIGSGTYRVDSIISATSIRICNDGAGLTPGSIVDAQDSNGNYVYPIILIDASPCTNPESLTGALVVCKGGIQQPLAAGGVGQVPVVVNATTNEVQFANLDIPSRCCTLLASCINFISGTSTYTIFVDANACAFQVGDILMLTDDPRSGRRFEITNIIDGTHYVVTVTPSVDYTETVAAGTQICAADCCEQLAAAIEDINDILDAPCTDTALTNGILDVAGQRVSIACKQYTNISPVPGSLPASPFSTLDEVISSVLYVDGGIQTDWLEIEVSNDSPCRVGVGALEFYVQANITPFCTDGGYVSGYLVPQIGYETFTIGQSGTRPWTHAGGDTYTQYPQCWIPVMFAYAKDADGQPLGVRMSTLNFTGFFTNIYADPGETIRIALRPQVQVIPGDPANTNRGVDIQCIGIQAKLALLHEPNALT